MTKSLQNIANLLEYFGFESRSYYHSVSAVNYDPNDLLAYYLDMSPRADYLGPFDPNGLPLMVLGEKLVIFPTHLIMYGLGHLEKYRQERQDECLARFRLCAEWLVDNQSDDGSWLVTVPNKPFKIAPPFRSAMVQGLAISMLVRASALLADDRFVNSATLGLQPFHHLTNDNGVTTKHEQGVFYEEYPCQPPRHVLNGFLYAMWGLHDLVRLDGNTEAQELWQSGLETLIKWLPDFDLGYWSLYQLPVRPCNPATVPYHRLHINQLDVMAAITSQPIFGEYRDRWQDYLGHRLNGVRTLPAKLRWLTGNK